MFRQAMFARTRGQAAVLAALAFVLLVGALGLALDGANAFGQRRLIGNAADAAAIAGTRELAAQIRDPTASPISFRSNGSTKVNAAVASFLNTRNDLHGATLSWQAFYVDRLTPDGSLGAVIDGGKPPSGADGVRVETTITFPTYFMSAFGRRTLTVSGNGTAVFGPLGTALGQDLAPLALSVTGLETLKSESEVRLDLKGYIADNPLLEYIDPLNPDAGFLPYTLPEDVVTAADIKHISFAEVNADPETGDDCLSATPVDALTYWWCQGSPNKLRINRELPAGAPNFPILNPTITWRKNNRNVLVLPVYADSLRNGDELYYQLVNFVAVEIVRFNSTEGVLTVRHLPNYATVGAMVGEGSGVETGVWAVNLTR